MMLWKKNQLAVLLTIVFLCVSFVSPPTSMAEDQGNRVKPRGTLRVVDSWSINSSLVANYSEGLVTLDRDNNFIPCLAEDWNWIDDKTIEFKLRRGVFFHNGEPFNSEAVKINWSAYMALNVPAYPFLNFSKETKLEMIDDYTVRFSFPETDGMALTKFGIFRQIAPAFFLNNKFVNTQWGNLMQAGPWGTGPFEVVEGKFLGELSDRIVFEANANYWDKRYPKVKTVIFDNTLIADLEAAVELCRNKEGAVDVVNFIRPIDTLKIAESPFAKVVKSKDFCQLHSAINQRRTGSKWRDIRLRKALSHAINREELWQYGAKGNAYNLGGHIPPGARGHNPDLKLYTYDTEKARALLKEAGYPDGFEMTLITPFAQELEAQVMKSMYERIGLKVTLKAFSWPEWAYKVSTFSEKKAQEEDWDVSVCYNNDWGGHSGSAHLVWPYLEGSWVRWIEYDQKFEKMWHDMARTFDEKQQDEKMRQMEAYIYEKAFAVFIYSPLSLYAVNKEVDFVPRKGLRLKLKETSVTDNHWSLRSK